VRLGLKQDIKPEVFTDQRHEVEPTCASEHRFWELQWLRHGVCALLAASEQLAIILCIVVDLLPNILSISSILTYNLFIIANF
jgi:hypothetical protein